MTTAYEFKTLGNEIEAATVGHVGPMADRYVSAGIPFLRSQNIKPNSISFSDVKFIDEKFHSELKKSALKAGDVAVVRTGYPGTAAVVSADMLPMNCADLVILTPGDQVDSRYLASLLNSSFGKALITGNTVGAAQQHFNVTTAKQIKLPLPSFPIQRKIAAILTAYDDLIENNRQRIALLEKMAEEIYREWFVRLRFPGHEHTPVHKGVPEGWSTSRIEDQATRHRFGRLYKESDLDESGKTIVIDQSVKPFLGFHNNEPDHLAALTEPKVLFGDHSCKFTMMVEPFSVAENVIPFSASDPLSSYYLYYAVKGQVETTEYKRHWTSLVKKEIYWPTEGLRRRFADFLLPNVELARSLKLQSRTLQKTRDLLLNRLISGKLRVDDLDIQFPPSMQAEAA